MRNMSKNKLKTQSSSLAKAEDKKNKNIKTGTEHMQYWMYKDDIAQSYKDDRGVSNGIFYNKIKSCADKLELQPGNMQTLRDMVKVK